MVLASADKSLTSALHYPRNNCHLPAASVRRLIAEKAIVVSTLRGEEVGERMAKKKQRVFANVVCRTTTRRFFRRSNEERCAAMRGLYVAAVRSFSMFFSS